MGDKGDSASTHEVMEGQNTDINPLKRARPQEIPEKETVTETVLPKRTQVGDGPALPPAPTTISMEDLMTEIRAVGRDTNAEIADLKQVVENSIGTVQKLDSRIGGVESIAESAHQMAKATRTEVQRLNEELKEVRRDLSSKQLQITTARRTVKALRNNLEKQEGYSRRYNLLFEGIPETEGETTEMLAQKVRSFLANILALSGMPFDILHRLGAKRPKGDRRVIVKFHSLSDKNMVWEARKKIRNNPETSYRVIMDRPAGVKDREALAYRIVQAAQQSGLYRVVRYRAGKLTLDEENFDFDDYDLLPEALKPASISTMKDERAIVFFSKYCPLSNHAATPFRLDGISYATMEQYLARARALLAKDRKMIRRIMESEDPVEHKRCLNALKADGKDALWKTSVATWLKPGLMAKFTQNKSAREFLLATGTLVIGEASMDEDWGIGKKLNDYKVLDLPNWKGKNMIGEALAEVRDKLH